MELKELKEILSSLEEFKDINSWNFIKLNSGGVGLHSCIISKGKKKYFVKDTKDNEANALALITPLQLKHFIKVRYPTLLEKKVLVASVIYGEPIKSKRLVPGLIKDFATMQNKLNNPAFFINKKYFSGNKFSDKDDGFFKRGYESNWDYSKKVLIDLKNKFDLEDDDKYIDLGIIDKYIGLMNHLDKNKDIIINECSIMPFAWQHHDFREANIIGKNQTLVDFGSSYGHGPFMFDLAPFLLNNDKSLKTFVKYSNICKKHSVEQIKRWVYVAAVVNMVSRLRYQLDSKKEKSETKRFLEYEWETHQHLLK